ncbi:MAG TPA: hypothetical protein VFV87_11090 [Pirellulaceae bacterium]|nr:hypothetical protein [Pirellulaceae bacterium]
MWKIIKLGIATLAALYTLGVVIGFVSNLGQHGGTRGVTHLAAGIGVTAASAAITWWLFTWALKKPNPPRV